MSFFRKNYAFDKREIRLEFNLFHFNLDDDEDGFDISIEFCRVGFERKLFGLQYCKSKIVKYKNLEIDFLFFNKLWMWPKQ